MSAIDNGRVPSGQALVSDEAATHLRPAGFDPSRCSVSPATCFTIRNGFYWAHIFVRAGVSAALDGFPRHWAVISVVSDFGSFGYCWSHMGEPWQDFIADLDFDYAMRKFMGQRFDEPLSIDDCKNKVRKLVVDERRQRNMSKEDARALWGVLPYCDEASTFLNDLDRYSDGAMYRHELWDQRWTQPSAQARGFWAEIWPHFIAIAIEARSDATGTGAAEGESAGPKDIAPNSVPVPSGDHSNGRQ